MKKEIEILFELKESEHSVIEKLKDFEYVGKKQTLDIYYVDPKRDDLKTSRDGRLNNSFRLRNKDGKCSIAYKVDHFKKDMWLYSDEYETEVGDFKKTQSIILKLGLETLVEVDTEKDIYKNSLFEIVIEKVKNLGLFLEVEYHFLADSKDIEDAKEYIRTWVKEKDIRVGEELNAGKPELLLRKNTK